MSITGQEAVEVLERLSDRVAPHIRDNTNKFRSYKLRGAKRTEFAFDSKTKNGLYIRVDREPPPLPGITNIERISGKNVSTAFDRVFSGGIHKANYKATVASETALLALIAHYESVGGA